jgi:hypothetical protein
MSYYDSAPTEKARQRKSCEASDEGTKNSRHERTDSTGVQQ